MFDLWVGKNALEEEMTTHSSILLAWEIPWTEEPGGLQSMGLQRVRLRDSVLTSPAGGFEPSPTPCLLGTTRSVSFALTYFLVTVW